MCGEKKPTTPVTVRCIGSPPHVRGKDVELFALFVHHGITPACAGKRLRFLPACLHRQDHPRVCGEKSLLLGSSGSMGDHPRTCGEKQMYFATTASCQGSPPHMRGKVIPCVFCLNHHGITPAHAGKSQGLNIFHTKRSSGPSPAAVPAGPAGSCPASRPSQFPPRMTVISPRP